jgi:hypothetical protein
MAGDHLDKMQCGWLLPYLLVLDTLDAPQHDFKGHGRWDYWLTACAHGAVPEGDIPQVAFTAWPDPQSVTHVQEVLKFYVGRNGIWYDDAWLHLVRWLLHGFGCKGLQADVERIPAEVRNFWYEQFNLAELLKSPADWSALVLQGGLPAMGAGRARWAESAGFFATPMNVCTMMTQMSFGDMDPEEAKLALTSDPCCGTGSMLLPASNYTLRLHGVDIIPDLCLCANLNGWLWAPWLVFMPEHMRRLFDELRGSVAPPPPPFRLETSPEHIVATQAYRAGEISQADFFSLIGM